MASIAIAGNDLEEISEATFPLKQGWLDRPQASLQGAEVRLAYDAEAFEVFIGAEEDFARNAVIADNTDAWEKGDLLEVFVQDPEADFYTEWHLTPEGHVWRKRFLLEHPDAEKPFNEEWIEVRGVPVVSQEMSDGVWQAHFRIPWEYLSRDGTRPDRLRWAVCRYDYPEDGGEPTLSSTAALTRLSFHRRAEWHEMYLAGGLEGPRFKWSGVDHIEITPNGIRPFRVSRDFLKEANATEALVARMTAGIELQMPGAGVSEMAVDYRTLADDGFPTNWALYLDGNKVHPTLSVPAGDRSPGQLRWQLPTNAEGECLRLSFPTHAEVELRGVQTKPSATEMPPLRERPRWLVHGDSITHGANVTSPDFTWVYQTAMALDWEPVNFGFGGNARAQPFMAEEIAERQDWDILSIHIGTNSLGEPPEVYAEKYRTFLDIIRAAHPDKPIICVTPIWHRSDGIEGKDSPAEQIREAIRIIVNERRLNDSQLHLLEGPDLLTGPAGYLEDLVHPSDHGAAEYARNLVKALNGLDFSEGD